MGHPVDYSEEKFKLKICFYSIFFKYDDSGGITCLGNDLKTDYQKSANYHTSALHQLAELAEIKQLQVANIHLTVLSF